MEKTITQILEQIETEKGVKIIMACESGSRAWGFPSTDSDYDVRFIYMHKKKWYLSVTEKRDVIERPVDKVLDVSGWDLRKSLRLMRKSNGALMEWLGSPIRYHAEQAACQKLVELSKAAFLPKTTCYHYLSMAKASRFKYKAMDRVKPKTYLYVIRPILCCQWIIAHQEQPPTRIQEMLAGIREDNPFKQKVIRLIEQKRDQTEGDTIERCDVIESYVTQKITEIEENIPDNPRKVEAQRFNKTFREILGE